MAKIAILTLKSGGGARMGKIRTYKDIAKYCPNTYHIQILPNEHHGSSAECSSSVHEKVNSVRRAP